MLLQGLPLSTISRVTIDVKGNFTLHCSIYRRYVYIVECNHFFLSSTSLFLLSFSSQALKIEAKLTNVQNPADTHINACAVLSQLGRHQAALEHAQSALILLQEELLSPPGNLICIGHPCYADTTNSSNLTLSLQLH